MQQMIGQSLRPVRPYTSFLAIPDINALMITERTSILRGAIERMEKEDMAAAKPSR
jgi:hypothetical protein